jgi:integral membrane protein (TIGR01906 family)
VDCRNRLVTGLGIWAWRGNWLRSFWQSISRGGFITTALILGILLLVMVSFNALFTAFHRIFFEGNTWIFLYSDTLIRLFPLPLWQDAFIFMGVFSLAGGLVLGFRWARFGPALNTAACFLSAS